MNILTLCEQGQNRSVVLASILRRKLHNKDIISAGCYTFSQETLVMLYDWADKIIVVEEGLVSLIHPEYQEKVILFPIGPDVWGFKPDINLIYRINELLETTNLIKKVNGDE